MKLSEFKKDEVFWCGNVPWVCTDVGSRVVIGIRLDDFRLGMCRKSPYDVAEVVFDEDDQEVCFLSQEEYHENYDKVERHKGLG